MTVLAAARASGDSEIVDDRDRRAAVSRQRGRAAGWVIAVVAGGFILMYVVVALLRLRYPYELEWIEGGMVNHVAQLRTGEPLYSAPSLSFTPDIYTPLYFVIAAVVSFVAGTGFVALRLVSLIASLVLLAALAKLGHRETRDPVAAFVAAGLFAACYRISGAWLDIAREDTLCLALLFCGLIVARDACSARRGFAAGVLMSLSFLAKQVALLPALGVGVFLVVARRGRSTVVAYLATVAAGIVGTSIVFDWITHGWYGFYVWRLPAEHQVNQGSLTGFFTNDLLAPLAIAVAIGAIGLAVLRSQRTSGFAFHVIVGAALLAASYSARLHTGGYDNVLLPVYAEIAVLFAIGLHHVLRAPKRTWLVALVAVACLLQFGRLVYDPVAQLPSRADVELGDQTLAALRRLPQPIYLPGHPWYLEEIGQPANAQSAAIGDVLRGGGTEAQKLAQDLWRTVAEQRYGSIVVESAVGYSYLPDNLCRYYEPARPLLPSGDVSYPITGTITGPAEVWLPRAVPDTRDCEAIGSWTVGIDGRTQ
ncbi:MAG TPA: glycosyltransferase family 39 protein [Acidimicrobiales bacterium]|nr:glycosyltransferase family 39 protein [Acidimicrobiales bacterium]